MNKVKEMEEYVPGWRWKRMRLGVRGEQGGGGIGRGGWGGGYCQDAKQIDEDKRKKGQNE